MRSDKFVSNTAKLGENEKLKSALRSGVRWTRMTIYILFTLESKGWDDLRRLSKVGRWQRIGVTIQAGEVGIQ
jgi:hypothetical protein